jgi:hypothetical protein
MHQDPRDPLLDPEEDPRVGAALDTIATALLTPPDELTAHRHRRGIARARRGQPLVVAQRSLTTGVAAAMLVGVLAVVGALPGPAQQVAADLAARVGLELPRPAGDEIPPADTTSPPPDAGSTEPDTDPTDPHGVSGEPADAGRERADGADADGRESRPQGRGAATTGQHGGGDTDHSESRRPTTPPSSRRPSEPPAPLPVPSDRGSAPANPPASPPAHTPAPDGTPGSTPGAPPGADQPPAAPAPPAPRQPAPGAGDGRNAGEEDGRTPRSDDGRDGGVERPDERATEAHATPATDPGAPGPIPGDGHRP